MSIGSEQDGVTNLERAIIKWANEGKSIDRNELNSKNWFARWREIAVGSTYKHGIILFVPGVTIEDILLPNNKST